MELNDKTAIIDYLLTQATNLPLLRHLTENDYATQFAISDICFKELNNYLLQIPNANIHYPVILVGGTNGKGSVCAYLSTILTLAGFKVGSFSSPHIFAYNERINLNNHMIDDNTLVYALKTIITLNQQVKINQQEINLGIFKTFALAAHLIFATKNIDIAIIEVGIGGRYDITNLFTPLISAITNVSFDHCHILGNSLEEIASNKAGIFRAGNNHRCFYGTNNPPQAILRTAAQLPANLQIFGRDFNSKLHEHSFDVITAKRNYFSLPYPRLRGNAQPTNVTLALAILAELTDFPVSISTIKTALLNIKLIGRFQVLAGYPQRVLDVAHNKAAVMHMLENMLQLPFAKHHYVVFGIAADKDIDSIISLCKNRFDHWFIATIANGKGLHHGKIMQALLNSGIHHTAVTVCATITAAYEQVQAISTKEDRIVCFGSFAVVAEVFHCERF